MSAHGTFHWNELMTRDVEGAKDFYGQTLGWTYDDMPMPFGSYTVIRHGDAYVGGMMAISPDDAHFEGVPNHWMAYISVDDVDARVARAEAAGATVISKPFDVKDVGRIAIVKQPDDAVIGWITPVPGEQG